MRDSRWSSLSTVTLENRIWSLLTSFPITRRDVPSPVERKSMWALSGSLSAFPRTYLLFFSRVAQHVFLLDCNCDPSIFVDIWWLSMVRDLDWNWFTHGVLSAFASISGNKTVVSNVACVVWYVEEFFWFRRHPYMHIDVITHTYSFYPRRSSTFSKVSPRFSRIERIWHFSWPTPGFFWMSASA